jgi:homoserine kinase type II
MSRHPLTSRPGRPLYDELFRFASPELDALTLRPEQVGLPPDAHAELFGWWREEAAYLQAFAAGAYRGLPRQLCHNDVTPNNVLAERGVVTAVLDFEYAIPIARALDFVTGLRTSMPYWKNPEPWAEARAYCRGFARWVALTEAEIAAVPDLLRLRAAITVLWWIGRAAATGTAGPLVSRMRFCQELWAWLVRAKAPLMAVVHSALRG